MTCNIVLKISVSRTQYLSQIEKSFEITPICALLGPRQCGKTTLSKQYQENNPGPFFVFDLEDDDHLTALENPKLALRHITSGTIIIDEIQSRPELFSYLRVFIDQNTDVKMLILGSASQELIRQSSETLAGRISYLEITPFSIYEITDTLQLWLRGGFPRSYLASSDDNSFGWRKSYIQTFLEKDIPAMGFNVTTQKVRQFWSMLCDYHGNIFNASALGNALDLNYKTVQRYLDILTGTFMVRTLQPWFANISKRQVKSPKIYFRDSGIMHTLLGIKDQHSLSLSSKVGASWEGFAMEEVIRYLNIDRHDCYFWATPSGAEVDLLIKKPEAMHAFEFKYSTKPKVSQSMIASIQSLGLEKMTVIVPGNSSYDLHDQVHVVGLDSLTHLGINAIP